MEITIDRLLATIGSLYIELGVVRAELAQAIKARDDMQAKLDSPDNKVKPLKPAG